MGHTWLRSPVERFTRGGEGVAPEARFVLVKTNFFDTDEAVVWCFSKSGSRPCVVNLSLGHHWGGHDGTSMEAQLYEMVNGRGKIVVASAGNEREWDIHIGHRFVANEVKTTGFRILRQPPPDPPFAAMTLWYDQGDSFDFSLITPGGHSLPVPSVSASGISFSNSQVEIELAHQPHAGSTPANRVQIQISFKSPLVSSNLLNGWSLRMECKSASVGRLDGWFNNSGFAVFSGSPLIETTRTIGLPATSNGVIAVASHVSSNSWESDLGPQSDPIVLPGRTSPFSSQGPTRDGRRKPEISAPGQYLTAGLAAFSESAADDERAQNAKRILSIEGTSMSAPMATGCIALMLQKKPSLTMSQIVGAFSDSATTDLHTGPVWNPAYGHGKIDISRAMTEI